MTNEVLNSWYQLYSKLREVNSDWVTGQDYGVATSQEEET
jgi:hypothetical protein